MDTNKHKLFLKDAVYQIVGGCNGCFEYVTEHEKGQILNYLKITGLKVGLILNFKCSTLEWERYVL